MKPYFRSSREISMATQWAWTTSVCSQKHQWRIRGQHHMHQCPQNETAWMDGSPGIYTNLHNIFWKAYRKDCMLREKALILAQWCGIIYLNCTQEYLKKRTVPETTLPALTGIQLGQQTLCSREVWFPTARSVECITKNFEWTAANLQLCT